MDVFNAFRVVEPKDKLASYIEILKLTSFELEKIRNISSALAISNARRLK